MQEEIRFVTSPSLLTNLKHDTEFSSQPVEKIHDGKNHTVRRWVQATVTESTKNPTLGIWGLAISDRRKWDLQRAKSESIKNALLNYTSSYVNYFINNPNLTTIFSHMEYGSTWFLMFSVQFLVMEGFSFFGCAYSKGLLLHRHLRKSHPGEHTQRMQF